MHTRGRGQSTIEYVVLLTGVIAVMLIFMRPGGVFRTALNKTLDQTTNGMLDMSNRLYNAMKNL